MSPEKSYLTKDLPNLKNLPDFVGPGGIPWFRTKTLVFHKSDSKVDTEYGWKAVVSGGSWFIHHFFHNDEASGFVLSTETPDGRAERFYKTLDEALHAAMEQAVILKLRS